MNAAQASYARAVGVVVRSSRLRQQRNQAWLAERAGITQAAVSNYEHGKRDMPLTTAIAVATALWPELSSGAALRRLHERAYMENSNPGREARRRAA